jgi:hypothetical protein
MALGDLAFEETGKFAGIRALTDGKVEATYQGTGKLFGAEYSSIYTGVATPHGGALIAEFNGICTTKDGGHCGCVGSWKGATYRKWPKGELAGRSYLADLLAEICKVK